MGKPRSNSVEPGSRERILAAAVRLFARKGFGSCGLRELAAEARVNLAMINYFFGSKKALLKEILDSFFTGYLGVAQKELSGDDPDGVKLRRFIHGAVHYFDQNQDYLLVTISELPHDDPEIVQHKAGWGKKMVGLVTTHLNIFHAEDGDGPMPPVLFCSTLTAMMAARFLFSPVMAQVHPQALDQISMAVYAEMISAVFIKNEFPTGVI